MREFNLMLDSGAFSAWMRKKEVDLETYIEFILKHDDDIDYVVGLDVIPSTYGAESVTSLEQEEAARKGWHNYLATIERGVAADKVIHVFHQGESFKWLKKAISKMDYIGLSPANDCPTKSKIRFLDECMNYVCTNGEPDLKFHGFGITSTEIMKRYPFYSIDSSSWVTFSRHGTMLIPKINTNGDFIYTKPPHEIQSTKRAASRKTSSLNHFDNMPKEMKEAIARYVHSRGFKMGKSYIQDGEEVVVRDGVMTNHRMRDLLNLMFYVDACKEAECHFYVSGNFPQMKDPYLETECFIIVCNHNNNIYNRLASFWFKDDCESVIDVKRTIYKVEG